jgi:uncharacterized protein YeeX (DUF496 family)
MTEETNAEVTTEVTEVEAPAAEETAVAVEEASEFTGEEIEKAVAISEVEDTLDFSKMVGDLKTFFNDSIEKNYSNQSASIRDVVKMVQDAKEEMTKSIDDLKAKNEELSKTITDMYGKIEYVDHQLKGFESATAVKKSSDLNGSMEETTIQKSIWQGHFLGVNSLTK